MDSGLTHPNVCTSSISKTASPHMRNCFSQLLTQRSGPTLGPDCTHTSAQPRKIESDSIFLCPTHEHPAKTNLVQPHFTVPSSTDPSANIYYRLHYTEIQPPSSPLKHGLSIPTWRLHLVGYHKKWSMISSSSVHMFNPSRAHQ